MTYLDEYLIKLNYNIFNKSNKNTNFISNQKLRINQYK